MYRTRPRVVRIQDPVRAHNIAHYYWDKGESLEKVGKRFDLTRERIRQLLEIMGVGTRRSKPRRICRKCGGPNTSHINSECTKCRRKCSECGASVIWLKANSKSRCRKCHTIARRAINHQKVMAAAAKVWPIYDKGATLRQLTLKFGHNAQTWCRIFKKAGYKLRKVGRKPKESHG